MIDAGVKVKAGVETAELEEGTPATEFPCMVTASFLPVLCNALSPRSPSRSTCGASLIAHILGRIIV